MFDKKLMSSCVLVTLSNCVSSINLNGSSLSIDRETRVKYNKNFTNNDSLAHVSYVCNGYIRNYFFILGRGQKCINSSHVILFCSFFFNFWKIMVLNIR